MNILAIETSSEACSCALRTDRGTIEHHQVAPRQHTRLLLPMIEQVLRDGELTLPEVDLFAYGRGPGSFTGVRIAACAVQGLALAVGRPVAPISSLAAAAARGAAGARQVIAAFDARLGEIYLGAFTVSRDGVTAPVGAEQLARADAVALPPDGEWIGVGAGWDAHRAALAARLGARLHAVYPQVLPGAAQIACLAAACPQAAVAAASALPGYLRREVATPKPAASVVDNDSGIHS